MCGGGYEVLHYIDCCLSHQVTYITHGLADSLSGLAIVCLGTCDSDQECLQTSNAYIYIVDMFPI